MSDIKITKLEKRCLKNSLLKKITLFLFFLLPSKITSIFVSLSIISMIMAIRNDKIQSDASVIEKINQVLKIHVTDNILLLPEQTLNWYWHPDLFDSRILVDNEMKTLREVILCNDDFMRYKGTVLNRMLDSLPKSIQMKLRLDNPETRVSIKHNIATTFVHG